MLFTQEADCSGAGMLGLMAWQPVPTSCSLAFGNWYSATMAHFKKGNILHANIWLWMVSISLFLLDLWLKGERNKNKSAKGIAIKKNMLCGGLLCWPAWRKAATAVLSQIAQWENLHTQHYLRTPERNHGRDTMKSIKSWRMDVRGWVPHSPSPPHLTQG